MVTNKLVAVCGATGKQGGGCARALLAAGGFDVRCLTRNSSSPAAGALISAGAEVVKADFEDPDSLAEAFRGCDAVFAVTDFWQSCQLDAEREKKQGMNLVDAAKAAGVKHFVWSTLEDTRLALAGLRPPLAGSYTVPHFDAKAEVDAYMRVELPGRCTALFTSVFYTNLLPGGSMDPQKQPDGSFLLFMPVGQAKLAWCDPEDIGGVAAAVIAGGPERWADKAVGVAGEHASLEDVAGLLSRTFGKKVVAVTPPADEWAQAVMGFGVPEGVARDLANMFVFYETVDMRALRPLEQTRELHPGVKSLQAWLGEHRAEFEQLFGSE